MDVTYFRAQRPGPETAIEKAVASHAARLFRLGSRNLWAAGSLSVGAGMPDLIFVAAGSAIAALPDADQSDTAILAYLQVIRRAKALTIAKRIQRPIEVVVVALEKLVSRRVIHFCRSVYSLSRKWRALLAEVVTVEAKVGKWRAALRQAARNRIFSHRSFVALPENLAARICSDPMVDQSGIGILSVSQEGAVKIVKAAVSAPPRVWSYYYHVALLAAKHTK